MQQAGGQQHAHGIRVEAFRLIQESLRILKGHVFRCCLEFHDFRFRQARKRQGRARIQTGCLLKLRYRFIETLIVFAQKVQSPIIEWCRLGGESLPWAPCPCKRKAAEIAPASASGMLPTVAGEYRPESCRTGTCVLRSMTDAWSCQLVAFAMHLGLQSMGRVQNLVCLFRGLNVVAYSF